MQTTYMRKEIHDIPGATRKLLGEDDAAIKAAADALRTSDPQFVTTVARGSSDNAATYLKYACELTLGLPVASIGPSIASIFEAELQLKNSACISISQSGQSPDIVSMATSATRQGSLSIALTNEPKSPLARACTHTIELCAGVETSVAATKTFVLSAVAGLALLAHWKRDAALIAALHALPDQFEQAATCDWPKLRDTLKGSNSLFVLGRGPSIAMSDEAALKFKETSQIHAESYSSAEVLHGPVSIVDPGFVVVALASRDAAEEAIVSVSEELAEKGASVFITSNKAVRTNQLEFVATNHPLTDPLTLIVAFYAFIESLSLERGINPDTPRNLKKVTETV